jgi:hypothetical protein
MRRTKRASQKRSQLAKQRTRRDGRGGVAATTGLNAMTKRSVGEFNHGFTQMNTYSVRSLERVFQAWAQFLDTGPFRQVVELQTQYAQNAQKAYEAYVNEISRLGEVYLNVTRRVSKPSAQVPRRQH